MSDVNRNEIIEKARQLGAALAGTHEYRAFQKAQAEVKSNTAAEFMLRDFRTRQFEIERAKVAGTFKPEMVHELQEKAQLVSANPVVRDFLVAENGFGSLMMEVQKLIGEPVGLHIDQGEDDGPSQGGAAGADAPAPAKQ